MKSLGALRGGQPEKKAIVDSEPLTGSQLEDLLIEKIDQHLQERNEPVYKKVDYFRPSSTNQCATYWWYMFNGVEYTPSFSPQTYRIFDNGHRVHDRLYEYFRGLGILVEEEFPVSNDDPPIQGTADGIIDLDGHKLIELKSISAEGFQYRQLSHKPSDDHVRQANLYMHCLNLDSGFVIYENKNNQQILPIYIERDDVFLDKLFKKYRKIYKAVQDGVKPDRPYKRTSKHCARCDLADLCWSEKESVEEYEPF
jgi:CRISPR/Cas system-associated exonuclease Cas4 (RecB family)